MSVAVPNQQLPHVYCEEGAQTRALALASVVHGRANVYNAGTKQLTMAPTARVKY